MNRYVYSDGSISFGATKVTGITKSSGKLFCHGKFVNVVEVNVILNRFGPWMKKLCGGVVLVRHNFRAFDEKHFLNNVKKWHLEDLFRSCIKTFADMLPLFQNPFPETHSTILKKNYVMKLSVKLR